jgi:hypothetical protein
MIRIEDRFSNDLGFTDQWINKHVKVQGLTNRFL